ncbi:MAG: tRNA 4-thiouridine(8) synthase ThiI, partial [Gemmatimonadetes bacterium]|nr:tRNA 4-thiouridine(8) synthase ThiI [Gemmatimonadota bacterium]
ARERLARVFGVSSVSRVDARIPAELDLIVETGRELYHEAVHGRTYAVDARRSGRHVFSSQDVRVQLGAALNPGATVDLDHPEVTVSVEVRDDEAFLFSGREEGVGGLPLGVEGTAVCLVSGGFDSAVAAWLLLRRGVSLEYVFCNMAGDAYERMVASIAKILADDWSFGDRPRLHVVDFNAVVDHLKETVEPRYWQLVLKRLMYRAAEQVAGDVGGEALITGESLGQVSSQTLGNLRAIDEVATLPVFRPLVGMDKQDIIRRAEHVGTAALSARVHEYCAILPDRPVTHSTPEKARAQEEGLDLALLERAVAAREILDLHALSAADLVGPYLFIDHIPEGAEVFDCRSEHQYRAWHWPGARHRTPEDVASHMKELSKETTYVLYCEHGVQTAHLAEVMQRVGYQAYSFRGGTRGLSAHAREKAAAVGT